MSIENRQLRSSDNEQERSLRESDARQLIHNLIGRNEEFFAEPSNRLEFIQSQDADSFFRMVHYINAKLRSEKPHELRQNENEKGGLLPMLHTPSHEDKPAAFKRGYEAIQDYVKGSLDPTDKKIEGAAMAIEALVIWVHPFNDGNGRTGRLLAKLVEEGAADIDSLVEETVSRNKRPRIYSDLNATRESNLELADNENIMLDDDERDELRAQAQSLPSDVDGMYLSIVSLLENDSVRKRSMRYVDKSKLAA